MFHGVSGILRDSLTQRFTLNLTTAYTGLSLGWNLFNALVVAVLGVPGFCLLLLVKWVLGGT